MIPLSAPMKEPLSPEERARYAQFFDGLAEEVRRTAEVRVFDEAPTVEQIVRERYASSGD